MHVSTLVRRSSALLAVLVAASACSDATSAPRAAERPALDIQALQPEASRSAGGWQTGKWKDGDDSVTTLRIDPNVSRTYSFGQNWIYFPSHSICDPATSGYGPTLWDTPCAALNQPTDVTVRWSNKGGYSYAKFTPQLRFVPADANNNSRWVILSLYVHKNLRSHSVYNILYDADKSGWVDEAVADPTLRAWIDPLHNSVVRRIKHFSGYMVAAAYSDGGLGGLGNATY